MAKEDGTGFLRQVINFEMARASCLRHLLRELSMTTRRHFIGLFPLAGATLLGACGGGGTSEASEEPTQGTGGGPDVVPAFVVVEDWTSGTAVDTGRIDFSSLVRDDSFEDAALAADCLGWQEHGPSAVTSLPTLNGVQFSAKRLTIRAGGRYSKTSYRIMVMMRALDLQDGLFGDIRGARTFPGPHKLRITNAAGESLKLIEMRDGLPMNHASLVNVPFNWSVTTRPSKLGDFPAVTYTGIRLPSDKPMRPHMSAGSCYLAVFGDAPESSAAVRDRMPRVSVDLWNGRATKVRSIYNGDDVHLWDPNYGGLGNGHPEVMPQWAMSQKDINALASVVQNDTALAGGQGYNWTNALRLGWDYEPGSLGGLTRRGGPGGLRFDRTVLPNEIYQMALTQTTRLNDGTPTSEMARGFSMNQGNYPGYYPRSMSTLDAINHFDPSPQPNVSGGKSIPVFHYYGTQVESYSQPGAIWIGDQYGGNVSAIASSIEWANPGVENSRSDSNHPRNGWCPDSEHNNRVGPSWAALLYSDPMFTRMTEHMTMFESHLMSPVLARANYNVYSSDINLFLREPGYFWSNRSNILPFCTAAMMWWTASKQGIYTRPQIEERLHSFFSKWKREVRDVITSNLSASTPGQAAFGLTGGLRVSWLTWQASGNFSAGSGWVAAFGIYSLYLSNLFTILKCSGLYDVLARNSDTATCLADLAKQLEVNARMFDFAPWAIASADAYSTPYLVLRSTAAGAINNDPSTIPRSFAEIEQHNPPSRVDDNWFLKTTATPGVDRLWALRTDGQFAFNYAGIARAQCAHQWWDLLSVTGAERDRSLERVSKRVRTMNNYSPGISDAGFTRFNSVQTIPGLAR